MGHAPWRKLTYEIVKIVYKNSATSQSTAMQRILIITLRHDVDSLLIGYGLKLLGAEPTYLFVDELFTQTSFSFRVGATQPRWSFSSDETWHDVDSYSTIWLRRLVHPKVGTNDLHPEDLDRVRENQAELFGQMWAEFCPNARWINSWPRWPLQIPPLMAAQIPPGRTR